MRLFINILLIVCECSYKIVAAMTGVVTAFLRDVCGGIVGAVTGAICGEPIVSECF